MKKRKVSVALAQGKIKRIIKNVLGILFAMLLLWQSVRFIFNKLIHLDYFKVKHILVEEGLESRMAYLSGRNIFDIDLSKEARYASGFFPSHKKIKLLRMLPDTISVELIRRVPVLSIKLYRYFYVDKNSVLFDMPESGEPADLPVVYGLETKIFGPKPGMYYDSQELKFAVEAAISFKNQKSLNGYSIKSINLSSMEDAWMLLDNGPRVVLGSEQINERMNTLASLATGMKDDFYRIDYIDLRYKDPVIKFK